MKNPQYFHLGHAAKTTIKDYTAIDRLAWVNAQLKVYKERGEGRTARGWRERCER